MIVQDLEQNTKEWHQWRSEGIGGSEIASVVNQNPYQTAYQLWQIKTGITSAPDLSNNWNIKRGHELEPLARKMVNTELNANFKPDLFQHDQHNYCKYSSDGFDNTRNEVIELKALGDKNHNIVLETKEVLHYYMPQCQWAMLITGAKLCHFISYNPSHPIPYKRIEVKPDKNVQDYLLLQAKIFWALVQTKTPPDMTDKDFEVVTNQDIDDLFAERNKLLESEKEIANKLQSINEKLRQACMNKNIVTTSGNKLFISYRKGSVDYSKIPQLQNVDLEPFRKAPTAVFNIRSS